MPKLINTIFTLRSHKRVRVPFDYPASASGGATPSGKGNFMTLQYENDINT